MLIKIPNVKIEAVGNFVSRRKISIEERLGGLIPEKRIARLKKSTGFESFSVAGEKICASDFCAAAAEKIFAETEINRDEIRAVIFVTQTADYILPATSHILQRRLNLARDIFVFDVNLGCTGFVAGIFMAASILQNVPRGKILLLCGDTPTKYSFAEDPATLSIFGDAGAAAVIGKSDGGEIFFNLETLGELSGAIIMERGGSRNSFFVENNSLNLRENFAAMDGAAVMDFSVKHVPKNLIELIKFSGVEISGVEKFFLHQANRLILENLAAQLGVSPERVPFAAGRIGNTSSASIPAAMTEIKEVSGLTILSGFGVGMAIASALVDLSGAIFLETGEL